MKQTLINRGFILALVTIALYSCKKEPEPVWVDKTETVPSVNYTSPKDFNKKMLPAPQQFAIDASKKVTITTSSGSNFTFDPGSFYNTSGYINSGNIDIKITEVNKTSEMIATGAGTEAIKGILASAGMFKIEASQSGKPINLDMNKPISVQIPAGPNATVDGFKLFKGTENPSEDKVVWDEAEQDSSTGFDSLRLEKIGSKNIFTFKMNFLNWCNLDQYYNYKQGTAESIKVSVTGDYGNLNTEIYLYFTTTGGAKGAVRMYSDQTNKQWNTSGYKLPLNDKFKIIATAININTKQLEYQILNITHETGKVHNFDRMTPISETDLEAIMKTL